jgi:hypothetical protein
VRTAVLTDTFMVDLDHFPENAWPEGGGGAARPAGYKGANGDPERFVGVIVSQAKRRGGQSLLASTAPTAGQSLQASAGRPA